MRHAVALARLAAASCLAVALASACGGKSFKAGDDDDDDDDNGGTSMGGSRAGNSNVAGKTPAGGKSSGGKSSGGGVSSGGAATAGSGSYAGSPCGAPPEAGPCDGLVRSWYHDPSTGICRPFVYGGCGGNANRYDSLEACQKVCSGGSPNFDACNKPTDCLVTGAGCCGVCDGPSLTKHDLLAYNRQYAGPLLCGVVLDTLPPPGSSDPIACEPCPSIGGGNLRYFVPDCVQNQCVVLDLRESSLTSCKTSSDCMLRYGTGCCQSCDPGDLISLRSDANLEQRVCANGVQPCAACLPQSNGAQANCNPNGHCEVVVPL